MTTVPTSIPSSTTVESTTTTTASKPKRSKKRINAAVAKTNLPLDPQHQKPPQQHQPPAPKRRKAPSSATTGTATTTTTAAKSTTGATTAPRSPPPSHILIIDNGGDSVKYGWASTTTSSSSRKCQQPEPSLMTNVTARLLHQWTVLVGDEWEDYCKQHAASSAASVSRSFERGILVNLGHQVMVWKRILDVLGVSVLISNKNSETAQALGWKAIKKTGPSQLQPSAMVAASSCAVLLLLPPYCPRVILDQIFHVWLEDFGFSHIGLALSSVCAVNIPQAFPSSDDASSTGCVCLVDLGWSGCHVIPTYRGRLIVPATKTTTTVATTSPTVANTAASCIRRLPLGGRHMINLWKYITTYRQWNLMDQETLLRQVHHQLAYVALHFKSELQLARQRPAGQRHYDREVVLPDFQTTFECKIRIPPALQRIQHQQVDVKSSNPVNDESDEDSNDDHATKKSSYGTNSQKKQEGGDEGDDLSQGGNKEAGGDSDGEDKKKDQGDDDEDDDVDDEEETLEEKRKRLVRQRQEEEERRRDEQQVLQVSVERFTIPEVLFRPSDAGLPESMASLPQAIVQAILACPRQYQAALFQSIHLVGGVAQLSNLSARLQRELRSLAPTQYEVKITVSSEPMTEAWKGAQAFVSQAPFECWAWSKQDWLPHVSKKSNHASAQTAPLPVSASHGLYAKLMSKNPGMFV